MKSELSVSSNLYNRCVLNKQGPDHLSDQGLVWVGGTGTGTSSFC